jgi:hypothetical protein
MRLLLACSRLRSLCQTLHRYDEQEGNLQPYYSPRIPALTVSRLFVVRSSYGRMNEMMISS